MARTAVNGAVIAIASTYGTAFNITAATNAAECVVTAAAGHSVVAGDIVEFVSSGWGRAAERIFRVKTVSTNDLTLEGFNTTSTTLYPAGSGTGTMRRITAWTNIQQITGITQSGGEQQFLQYQYSEQDQQSQVPTNRTATSLAFETHDDLALSHVALIQAAQAAQTLTAFRIVMRDGKRWFGNGYWSIASFPDMESNNVLRRTINVALVGDPPATAYAS